MAPKRPWRTKKAYNDLENKNVSLLEFYQNGVWWCGSTAESAKYYNSPAQYRVGGKRLGKWTGLHTAYWKNPSSIWRVLLKQSKISLF